MAKDDQNDIEETPWGIGASLGVGLAAFLLPQVIAGVIIAIIASVRDQEVSEFVGDENYALSFVLTLAISLIGSWIIFTYVKGKKNFRHLGLVKTSIDDMLTALPAYFVYFVIAFVVNIGLVAFSPELNLDQAQDNAFESAGGFSLVIAFLTLVGIAPLYEELLFRGFVFRGVASRVGMWPAAISTSALFGLAHGQLNVAIDTFILGVVASWLVWKTKSIWPAIILHGIKNTVAYLFIFVFKVEL